MRILVVVSSILLVFSHLSEAYAWSLFSRKSPEEIQACEERYVRESTRICYEQEKSKIEMMDDEELILTYGDYNSALRSAYQSCAKYYRKAVKTFNVC